MLSDDLKGWDRGKGGRLQREGIDVWFWLICIVVRQKSTQHGKANFPQLKINFKKSSKHYESFLIPSRTKLKMKKWETLASVRLYTFMVNIFPTRWKSTHPKTSINIRQNKQQEIHSKRDIIIKHKETIKKEVNAILTEWKIEKYKHTQKLDNGIRKQRL